MRHSLAQNVCVLVCKLFECLHALAWTVRTGESSWCKLQVKQLCKGVRNSCTSEAVKWSLLCCGTICFVKGTSCKRIQEEAQEAVEDGFRHPQVRLFKKLGCSGQYPGNLERDFITKAIVCEAPYFELCACLLACRGSKDVQHLGGASRCEHYQGMPSIGQAQGCIAFAFGCSFKRVHLSTFGHARKQVPMHCMPMRCLQSLGRSQSDSKRCSCLVMAATWRDSGIVCTAKHCSPQQNVHARLSLNRSKMSRGCSTIVHGSRFFKAQTPSCHL